MRDAVAYVPEGQHTTVAAAIRQAFLRRDTELARQNLSACPTSCADAGPLSRR
jgi:hypothetical protein